MRRSSRIRWIGYSFACAAMVAFGSASPASASGVGKVTVYSSVGASSIAPGSDGNVWVASGGNISKVSTSGQVLATYSVPNASGLTQGPDGRIWFDDGSGLIGRINSSGKVTTFSVPSECGSPSAGPGLQIWMRCGNDAGRLLIKTGHVDEFPLPNGTQTDFVLGRDGNMWFGDLSGITYQVGRIARNGKGLKLYNLGYECTSGFDGITPGPGDRIWFEGFNDFEHCNGGAVGSISTSGAGGPGACCNSAQFSGITVGPDRRIWVGDQSPYQAIWRVSPDGSLTRFGIPGGTSTDPIPGSDGRVWFIDDGVLAAVTTSAS